MISVDKDVFRQFEGFARRHSKFECGAYLIGTRLPGTFKEDDFEITDLYICKDLGSSSDFTFSTKSQINVLQYISRKYTNNKVCPTVIGTIHSHAHYHAFFSTVDKSTYQRFGSKTLCFMVYSPFFKEILACSKNLAKDVLKTKISFYTKRNPKAIQNEEVVASFCTKDGKNKVEIFKSEFMEDFYSSKLLNNKVCRFRVQPFLSEQTKKRNEIRTPYLHTSLSEKRILVVGAGTIGSAFLATLKGSGVKNITIIDLDEYDIVNVSRTAGIGFGIAANHEKKAFSLAREVALESAEELVINGIASDITSFGHSFVKYFDLVVCLADNNVVRAFTSFACKMYNKPFIQGGTTVFNGNIIGQISIQPEASEVCFSCVEKIDFKTLLKRTGCSQLDEGVGPQVSYMAFKLAAGIADWTIQILNKKVSIKEYTRICYFGANNPAREYRKEVFVQKSSVCPVHKAFEQKIAHITCKRNSGDLYKLLKDKIFHTDSIFSILVKESMLVFLFANKTKPVLSIDLIPKVKNPTINLLPRESIYTIYNNANGELAYVQITFID